jgi:PAS domain S-box-containing protein
VVLAAANAFVAFDDQGTITDWNGQSEALFGWMRGEALGRRLAQLILPADAPLAPGRLELTGVRRDGHRFPIEMSVFTFSIDERPAFAAFITDITPRRKAEEQMRHHDAVLRAVLEDSSDVVLAKDQDLKVALANRTASRVMGVPVENLVGRSFLDLQPKAIARHIEENDRMVLKLGRPMLFEEVLATPEGERTFLMSKSPYRNHRGEVCGIICRGHDTTARARRKQASKKLERRLLERMRDSCVGISYGTLGASVMLDANERYTHVFGRKRTEMVGHEMATMDAFADAQDGARMTVQLGQTGAFPLSHVTFRRKDGSPSPSLFALRLVEIDSRLVWVAMVIDARAGDPLRRELAEIEGLAAELGRQSLG